MATMPDRAVAGEPDAHTLQRLALRDALQALPPRQRAVVVLRYLEDMSLEETAKTLGCRIGTVGSQATRALVKLREMVKDLDWEVAR
jgi:RNA polymerase sigma factor (sigma-70 family)